MIVEGSLAETIWAPVMTPHRKAGHMIALVSHQAPVCPRIVLPLSIAEAGHQNLVREHIRPLDRTIEPLLPLSIDAHRSFPIHVASGSLIWCITQLRRAGSWRSSVSAFGGVAALQAGAACPGVLPHCVMADAKTYLYPIDDARALAGQIFPLRTALLRDLLFERGIAGMVQ